MVKIKVESLANEPTQNEIVKEESSSDGEAPEPIEEMKTKPTKKTPPQKNGFMPKLWQGNAAKNPQVLPLFEV